MVVQPASTATKPSGEASVQHRRNQPASNSSPRQRSHQTRHDQREHETADPHHDPEREEGNATGEGARSAGQSLRPCTAPFGIMGQDEAAQVRDRDGVTVRLGLLVGNGEQSERNAAHAYPRCASIAASFAG